jgi:hypothetical protein
MMSRKLVAASTICLWILLGMSLTAAAKTDPQKGSIKGRVRAESGATVGGVTVTAFQGEREEGRATSNRKGEFEIVNLNPGVYKLTFRKPGLSVGTIEKVEVTAGKARSLSDHLIMSVDEGTLAFLRGSVFTPDGRSVRGVEVVLNRVEVGAVGKKLDGRMTDETGSFVFRLPPDRAQYRVTLRIDGKNITAKDVEIDGAAIYRVALSTEPAASAANSATTPPHK